MNVYSSGCLSRLMYLYIIMRVDKKTDAYNNIIFLLSWIVSWNLNETFWHRQDTEQFLHILNCVLCHKIQILFFIRQVDADAYFTFVSCIMLKKLLVIRYRTFYIPQLCFIISLIIRLINAEVLIFFHILKMLNVLLFK